MLNRRSSIKELQRTSGLWLGVFCAFLALSLASCKKAPAPSTPEWTADQQEETPTNKVNLKSVSPDKKADKPTTFVSYNLRNYLQMKRSVNGELKLAGRPDQEIEQLISVIKSLQPDILGVSEIGTMEDLKDLQRRLNLQGVDLPHLYHTHGSDPIRQQGILSRYPITANPRPELSFTMNGKTEEIRRGIADIFVDTPTGLIRLLGVHLKSKRPNPHFDQELMRRQEAYTLRKHIIKILTESPQQKLIVYGDFNDTKRSATVKAIRGPAKKNHYLWPVDLKAPNGTSWTHHWSHQDVYSRIDFVFTNKAMRRHILHKKCLIPDISLYTKASDHRPLKVVFQ